MTKNDDAGRLTAELQECIGEFFQRTTFKQEKLYEIIRSFKIASG